MLINVGPDIDPKWRGEVADHHDKETIALIKETGKRALYFDIAEGIFNGSVDHYLPFKDKSYRWLINRTLGQWIHRDAYFQWDREKYDITSHYGVSDNLVQVLEYHQAILDNPQTNCYISIQPMYKGDQPETGGWRWHKWGDYIGKGEPTTEYLYDEELIDVVMVFGISHIESNDQYNYVTDHKDYEISDVLDKAIQYDKDVAKVSTERLDD